MKIKNNIKFSLCFLFLLSLADSADDGCVAKPQVKMSEAMKGEMNLRICLRTSSFNIMRPSKTPEEIVQINITSKIFVVTQLKPTTGFVTVDALMTYSWSDYRLVWKPEDYGGIKEILMNVWEIWEPELIIYDGREDTGSLVENRKLVVRYDGVVTWTPMLRMNVHCLTDFRHFPYDSQTCRFVFQRQIFESKFVKLNVPKARFMCGSVHHEWKISSCTLRVEEEMIEDKNQELVLEMKMNRTPKYLEYVLVLPAVIIAFLIHSLLWIPHHSNQRFALAGGLLFAILLLLVMIQNFLPYGLGEIPVIVSYLVYLLVILVFVSIVSLVTQTISFLDPSSHKMPDIIKKVFLNDKLCLITQVNNQSPIPEGDASNFENVSWNKDSSSSSQVPPTSSSNDKLLDSICKQLDILTSCENGPVFENYWLQLSQIIDRLLFYILIFIFIIVTSSILSH